MLRNLKYILIGLAVFTLFFTSPFWLNISASDYHYRGPALTLPEGLDQCIEKTGYMRTEHMNLLADWREKAVREGRREYIDSRGNIWEVSLQNTCLSCHADRSAFCDKCHASLGVSPDCWSCHLEPGAALR